MSLLIFMVNELKCKMVARFVDIDVIVDHHFLNFLSFKIQ